MKKQLEKIYSEIKGDTSFYSFATFEVDARAFVRDIKSHAIVCSMGVSRSGMTRKFNFLRYNRFLNVCYSRKASSDAVIVNGCGMDMLWHLLFTSIEKICTKSVIERNFLNGACSYQNVL